MSAVFNDYYEVTSNREEGLGRYDIQLKPYNLYNPGYVIELKALRQMGIKEEEVGEKLQDLAEDALNQIETKEYCTGLRRHGCQKIVKLGIAFYRKNCKAVVEYEN